MSDISDFYGSLLQKFVFPTENSELKICRICCKVEESESCKFTALSIKNGSDDGGSRLTTAELLDYCTGLKISVYESYRQSICGGCLEDLNHCYQFKQRCLKSTKRFNKKSRKLKKSKRSSLSSSRKRRRISDSSFNTTLNVSTDINLTSGNNDDSVMMEDSKEDIIVDEHLAATISSNSEKNDEVITDFKEEIDAVEDSKNLDKEIVTFDERLARLNLDKEFGPDKLDIDRIISVLRNGLSKESEADKMAIDEESVIQNQNKEIPPSTEGLIQQNQDKEVESNSNQLNITTDVPNTTENVEFDNISIKSEATTVDFEEAMKEEFNGTGFPMFSTLTEDTINENDARGEEVAEGIEEQFRLCGSDEEDEKPDISTINLSVPYGGEMMEDSKENILSTIDFAKYMISPGFEADLNATGMGEVSDINMNSMAPLKENVDSNSSDTPPIDLLDLRLQPVIKLEKLSIFVCQFCDADHFLSELEYKCHRMLNHPNELDHSNVCEVCEKHFVFDHRLISHVRIAHSAMFIECDYCQKFLRSEEHLKKHNYREHICKVCKKVFHNKSALKDHAEEDHIEKFYCNFCKWMDKWYKTEDEQKKHENSHFSKPYRCELCQIEFEFVADLFDHRKREHITKQYKCSYCLVRYSKAMYKEAHEKICQRRYKEEVVQYNQDVVEVLNLS